MELRRDPITQSWVIQGDSDDSWPEDAPCPLCPGQEELLGRAIYEYPFGNPNWQVRVVPHLRPLYRIEGDAQRRGEGLYDKMRSLGAHEIVIENPNHDLRLRDQSDEQGAQVLRAFVARIADLKGDRRFRFVTIFRNHGTAAGQYLQHPHSEITATTFIPRRVGYELRSFRRYYELKERCLLCDILKQEISQRIRAIEWDDQFIAFCPFASRVPYETWVMPISHHSAFEEDLKDWDRQLRFARFLKLILQSVTWVAPAYHLVLHTSPNVAAKYDRAGNWQTLADDYHWHFEILPVIPAKSRSYSLKEVYYNSMLPEQAASELREATVQAGVRS